MKRICCAAGAYKLNRFPAFLVSLMSNNNSNKNKKCHQNPYQTQSERIFLSVAGLAGWLLPGIEIKESLITLFGSRLETTGRHLILYCCILQFTVCQSPSRRDEIFQFRGFDCVRFVVSSLRILLQRIIDQV